VRCYLGSWSRRSDAKVVVAKVAMREESKKSPRRGWLWLWFGAWSVVLFAKSSTGSIRPARVEIGQNGLKSCCCGLRSCNANVMAASFRTGRTGELEPGPRGQNRFFTLLRASDRLSSIHCGFVIRGWSMDDSSRPLRDSGVVSAWPHLPACACPGCNLYMGLLQAGWADWSLEARSLTACRMAAALSRHLLRALSREQRRAANQRFRIEESRITKRQQTMRNYR
jgi:hypothetical protein